MCALEEEDRNGDPWLGVPNLPGFTDGPLQARQGGLAGAAECVVTLRGNTEYVSFRAAHGDTQRDEHSTHQHAA